MADAWMQRAVPKTLVLLVLVAVFAAGAADSAWAQAAVQPVGRVESAAGTVFAVRTDGTRVAVVAGDPFFQGDAVETGPTGMIGIVFIDGTTFSLGGGGRMVVDELAYDPQARAGSASLAVLHGVFSLISGQIARSGSQKMVVRTPVVAIGIRGTRVAGFVAPQASSLFVLLADLDGTVGEVTLTNRRGDARVLNQANQSIWVTDADEPLPPPGRFADRDVDSLLGLTLGILPVPPPTALPSGPTPPAAAPPAPPSSPPGAAGPRPNGPGRGDHKARDGAGPSLVDRVTDLLRDVRERIERVADVRHDNRAEWAVETRGVRGRVAYDGRDEERGAAARAAVRAERDEVRADARYGRDVAPEARYPHDEARVWVEARAERSFEGRGNAPAEHAVEVRLNAPAERAVEARAEARVERQPEARAEARIERAAEERTEAPGRAKETRDVGAESLVHAADVRGNGEGAEARIEGPAARALEERVGLPDHKEPPGQMEAVGHGVVGG